MNSLPFLILITAVVIQSTPSDSIKESETFFPKSNDLKVGSKIFGGTQVTNETKHPYQVWLQDERLFFCGGSIIAADVILTTAYCVYKSRIVNIHAGDVNLDVTSGKEQVRRVTSDNVTIHPDFGSILLRNDVAIIKLDTPFDLNENVNVIPLERENLTHNLHVGEEGTILGWGATSDTSGLPRVLYDADGVVIITNEKCSETYGPLNEGIMCADTSNGKSICSSDYGSPFIQENNGRWEQIGINSFKDAAGCTVGYPIGFTRVSVYIGWIEAELGRTLV